MCTTSEPKRRQSGQLWEANLKEGARTRFFAPSVKGLPLVAGWHVKQVSDDWEPLGSRREGVLATFLASGEGHGHQTDSKNDGQIFGEKTRKHFFGGSGAAHRDVE